MISYSFAKRGVQMIALALSILFPKHLFTQNQAENPMKTIAEKIIFSPIADQVKYREVSEADIQALEDELYFEIPFELKSFYREKGSFYYWARGLKQEDTNVVISADLFKVDLDYNFHQFPLYDFLSSCIGDVEALGPNFLKEKDYLNSCFAVYASIDEEFEGVRFMEYFYFDALGNYGSLRFENVERHNLAGLINELVTRKEDFRSFMSTRQAKVNQEENAEKEEEAAEERRKREYLEQHQLRAVTYQEVLDLLDTEELFGYHDPYGEGDEGEWVDEIYAEDGINIFYADDDVEIDGDFDIPEVWGGEMVLIVVDGDLSVNGKMRYSYFVTGDASFDFLWMNGRQRCLGEEQVKYLQLETAEDHEATYISKPRKVSAPYFFSWFYDLSAYEFSPETCVYGMYSWYEQRYFSTDNPYYIWQEPSFMLQPELVWTLNNSDSDEFLVNVDEVYQYLRQGKDIFIDGFDPRCLPYFRKGKALLREEAYESAFLHFKKVIELSPNFYLAYSNAALCLRKASAYAQALVYDKKGMELLPAKLTFPAYACAEGAGLSALILEDYDEANRIADRIIERSDQNYFGLRLKAEAALAKGELATAKSLLLKSVDLESAFTNHWLLGLIYFQEQDTAKAEAHFRMAQRNNAKAQPYSEHQNLSYFYGTNQEVDWETKSLEDLPEVEKDQTYWNAFFSRNLEKFSSNAWAYDFVQDIPEEFRTRQMLVRLLDFDTSSGRAAKHFSLVIDKQLAMRAVGADAPCSLSDLPKTLIDRDICLSLKSNLMLAEVPAAVLDYDICYLAVKQWAINLKQVPQKFRDEKMYIAAIHGGALEDYSKANLPQKYFADDAIFKALDLSLLTLERIPPRYVNKAIYEYGKAKYGDTSAWKELVSKFDREAYRRNGEPEFDYDTFSKVWACFWDEQFILDAINVEGEGERIYQLPRQYFTQKIAEAAVAKNSYDFEFVPKEFITPEMCRLACSQDYGGALEYVPMPLRTAELCSIAVGRDGENLAFVPDSLKTIPICMRALLDDSNHLRFIPYDLYPSVFEELLRKFSNRFKLGFIYRGKGIGAFQQGDYVAAIQNFQKIHTLDEEEASTVHKQHSLYYEGWANYKLGRLEEAVRLFEQATLKQDEDYLTRPYEEAALPPVFNVVHDLNKYEFGQLLQQASFLVEHRAFSEALAILRQAERLLTEANCSDLALWAIVWDHQRFALHESGQKEKAYLVCERSIAKLSEVVLWDYVADFNPIRHSLRAMHNMLAYRTLESAEDLSALQEGLHHSNLSFSIFSPIEDETVLYSFYETKALLLDRLSQLDKKYEKRLDLILGKIKKLNLTDTEFLSEEFRAKFGL
ncbi:MAG: hypothetical protein KTR30_04210 [Saprospiraceae bacterium]|nr:hypothetical protein [Saprospiraceae bacterium]